MDASAMGLSLCRDGLIHCFRVKDDGEPVSAPSCGAKTTAVSEGGDNDTMCERCANLFARWAQPSDPAAFLRRAKIALGRGGEKN